MNDERARLQSIAWLDLCPWLMLFRCPGLALRLDTLFLATLGGLLTSAAWWLSGLIFFPNPPVINENQAAQEMQDAARGEASPAPPAQAGSGDKQDQQPRDPAFPYVFHHLRALPGEEPPLRTQDPDATQMAAPRSPAEYVRDAFTDHLVDPIHRTWFHFVLPCLRMLGHHVTLGQFMYLVVGGMLSLVIWSLIGGAITRTTALQLGREQRLGVRASLRFSLGKLLSYFSAPLYPLMGVALFCGAMFLFVGLPMNADVGLLWAGLVWIFALIFGALMALLLLGLLFGWPLMWATISTEGSDAFDALSRSYAYTFQRPLHYLFFAIVAAVLGALTWMLVLQLGAFIVHFTWWAADWGIFDEKRHGFALAVAAGDTQALEEFSPLGRFGLRLIGLCNSLVFAAAYSFSYGYFWVAATAMYLLLRREVDHTETDEVYTDDEGELFGLPPLAKDAAGVPGVANEIPGERPAGFDEPDGGLADADE
jgi:hypothetical protein